MIEEKYIRKIKKILENHLEEKDRVFVFGSSVEGEKFADVDLAVVSDRENLDKTLMRIREDLEESNLPYKFDVINFNQAKESFRNRVIESPKIWII